MTKHEDQKPITEYTLEELLPALNEALAAFQKEYYSPVKAAQRRCRKVSRTLEKLCKQYRRVTIADGKE
jgi:hypothetical protein